MIFFLLAILLVVTILNLVGNREAIPLDAKNRMFRPFAIGYNEDRLFVRTDLWVRGWRWTF